MKRTPLKRTGSLNRGTKGLSRGTGLKKQSASHKAGKEERREHGKKIMDCFRRVKDARSYMNFSNDGTWNGNFSWICEETGVRIYNLTTWNLHHVLHKSLYPEYADKDWNIMIVTQEAHNYAHSDLDKVPKIKARMEELFQKHINGEL